MGRTARAMDILSKEAATRVPIAAPHNADRMTNAAVKRYLLNGGFNPTR